MFSVTDTVPPVLLAQIVYWVVAINSVGVPQMVWFAEVNVRPAGKVPSNSQVSISPDPVVVMAIDEIAVLFVAVVFSGVIDKPGTWSFTVMFSVAETVPPVLLAQIVYWVVAISSVGVPQMVWFAAVNVSPAGRVPSNSQVRISPGPFVVITIAVIAVLLVAAIFSDGEIDKLAGTWSLIVILMLVVELPFALVAVM